MNSSSRGKNEKMFQRRLKEDPSSTRYVVYFYVVIFICLIAVMVHLLGLLAICFHNKKTNQNLILAFLGATEILASIHRVAYEITIMAINEKQLVYTPITGTVLPASFYLKGLYRVFMGSILHHDCLRPFCSARYFWRNPSLSMKIASDPES